MRTPSDATRMLIGLLLGVLCAGMPFSAQAEDRVAHIFQDNMVLQRDKPVPVWGWGNPGTIVEVAFASQKKQTKVDERGYWKAVLDPLTASREGQDLEVRIGDTAFTRKNVLVGEVWIVAGASNTAHEGPDLDTGVWPHYVSPGTKGGKPEIRFMKFGFGASLEPFEDVDPAARGDVPWSVLQEDPAPEVMGPAHYFARVVRDELDVPVGIIHLLLVTATGPNTWTSRETLESFPASNGMENYYQEAMAAHEVTGKGGWETFKKAEEEWRVAKKGRWPGTAKLNAIPTLGYNTRLYPLAPFAVRGALYTSSMGGPGASERVVAMVQQWRKLFDQNLYFINCTNFRYTTTPPPLVPIISASWVASASTAVRETMKLFGDDKNVAVVETCDIGDWVTHYLQKAEMGRRWGLAALTLAYGQNHLYTGPRAVETKIEGNKAIVRFAEVGEGIVYQPSIDGISGVYLRGKTGPSHWGEVKVVSKDTVEFSHPDIVDLETAVYGENINPHETLFNSGALPASPFTVNFVKGRDAASPFEILRIVDKDGKERGLTVDGFMVSLPHVRRSGYVFQVVPKEKDDPAMLAKPGEEGDMGKMKGMAMMKAYIPAEWKGFEVESGGKPLEVTESSEDGAKFVSFNAPMDLSWVIVAEAGKAADFRKVNRY